MKSDIQTVVLYAN